MITHDSPKIVIITSDGATLASYPVEREIHSMFCKIGIPSGGFRVPDYFSVPDEVQGMEIEAAHVRTFQCYDDRVEVYLKSPEEDHADASKPVVNLGFEQSDVIVAILADMGLLPPNVGTVVITLEPGEPVILTYSTFVKPKEGFDLVTLADAVRRMVKPE